VALKILPAERARDPEARARFLREMKAVGGLEHPHIVAALDAGEAEGRLYLAMEFVDGLSLAEVLERHGPLPVADACEAARQAALGLQHAHEHGLVHRDVKPANLRLTPAGQVKVLDLGLAHFLCDDPAARQGLTAAGHTLGTADYMAPEQWADPRTADIRADLYSLGCTLYGLLAGRPPFGGAEYDTWRKKMQAHEQAPVPPIRGLRPEVPDGLAALLERLLAKKPADRPATPAEVAEALAAYSAGSDLGRLVRDAEQTRAHPGPQAAPVVPPPGARGWRGLVLLGLAAALVLGVLAWWRPWAASAEGADAGDGAGSPAVAPLKGSIDVRLWEKGNPLRQGLRLHQEGALPLRTGDWLRVEVKLSRPGYPYVVWLDSTGKATPLYPWQQGDWRKRPAREPRRDRLSLPEDDAAGAPLADSPTGIECLLLLACEEPLPAGADVAGLFAGLPRQQGQARLQAAAWFENGELVQDEEGRGPMQIEQAGAVGDPVLQAQALLRGRLAGRFALTRAVCFSFQGTARQREAVEEGP
jgi:hypothetical protein